VKVYYREVWCNPEASAETLRDYGRLIRLVPLVRIPPADAAGESQPSEAA
jgi:hypothetical protein